MSYLDRRDLLSADLMTRSISKEGSIKYYNSDKNVANIYMKLMAESPDGAQKEVAVDEASNYTVTIDAIKSKTNQIRTVPGVLSNDLTDETCAIWKFELGEDLTNQIGEVICQTYVKNTTQNLTMRYFAYTVEADKLTGLNSEIVTDPDLPILKELIKEVQETAQTVNNIDNVNVSDTKTYSNKKIEEKFSGVDAQFNTVVNEKRNKSEKIKGNELDVTSSEAYKIPINALSSEVISAMTGNTPISRQLYNKAVSIEKTSFYELQNYNMYNPNEETIGFYLGNTNNMIVNANSKVSGYIEVIEGQIYTVNTTLAIAFYNDSKNYVTSLPANSYTSPFAVPTGQSIKYARTSYDLSKNARFYEGNYTGDYTEYGNYKVKFNNIPLVNATKTLVSETVNESTTYTKNNVIPLKAIDLLTFNRINLFNYKTVSDGKFVSHINGNLNSVAQYSASDYIEVEGNTVYNMTNNQKNNIAWYDENKVFISGLQGGWSGTLTSPQNAKYIRITILTTGLQNTMFVKGDTLPTSYLPYEHEDITLSSETVKNALLSELNGNYSKLKGKKWCHIGDSISSTDYATPTWFEMLTENKGVNLISYGISGTTFAHKARTEVTDEEYDINTDRHLFDYHFAKLNPVDIGYKRKDSTTWSTGNCVVERYVKMDNDADLITVMVGTNDDGIAIGTPQDEVTSTVYGACNILFKGLINKYPTKKIAFITPIQKASDYNSNVHNPIEVLATKQPTNTATLQLRVEIYKQMAKKYGIPVLDLYNTSGFNGVGNRANYLYRDGIHPTNAGQELLSTLIGNFVETLF